MPAAYRRIATMLRFIANLHRVGTQYPEDEWLDVWYGFHCTFCGGSFVGNGCVCGPGAVEERLAASRDRFLRSMGGESAVAVARVRRDWASMGDDEIEALPPVAKSVAKLNQARDRWFSAKHPRDHDEADFNEAMDLQQALIGEAIGVRLCLQCRGFISFEAPREKVYCDAKCAKAAEVKRSRARKAGKPVQRSYEPCTTADALLEQHLSFTKQEAIAAHRESCAKCSADGWCAEVDRMTSELADVRNSTRESLHRS